MKFSNSESKIRKRPEVISDDESSTGSVDRSENYQNNKNNKNNNDDSKNKNKININSTCLTANNEASKIALELASDTNKDFDVVAAINKMFPTGPVNSVEISACIHSLQSEIESLDVSLRNEIQNFISDAESDDSSDINNLENENKKNDQIIIQKHSKPLAEFNNSLNSLKDSLESVLSQAAQRSSNLTPVVDHIRLLHSATDHLTAAVAIVHQYNLYIETCKILKDAAAAQKYAAMIDPLKILEGLDDVLQPHLECINIRDALTSKKELLNDIRIKILNDIDNALMTPGVSFSVVDCCKAAETISLKLKQDITVMYFSNVLEPFNSKFDRSNQISTLPPQVGIERRIIWFRRVMTEQQPKMQALFPASWNVPRTVAYQFCLLLRNHVLQIIEHSASLDDPTAVARSLMTAREFENYLSETYDSKNSSSSESEVKKFSGIVTDSFEPFLGGWLQLEASRLNAIITVSPSDDKPHQFASSVPSPQLATSDDKNPKSCISSTMAYLAALRSAFERTSALGSKFLHSKMFRVFDRHTVQYVASLRSRIPPLPPPESSNSAVEDVANELFLTSAVVGSVQLLTASITQLECLFQRDLDVETASSLSFTDSISSLSSLRAHASQRIVKLFFLSVLHPHLICPLQNSLRNNDHRPVRSPSAWIPSLMEAFNGFLDLLPMYCSDSICRFILDQTFLQIICHFFHTAISTVPLTETSSQQLLLDSTSLRDLLLSSAHSSNRRNSFVNKFLGTCLVVFKVLSSSFAMQPITAEMLDSYASMILECAGSVASLSSNNIIQMINNGIPSISDSKIKNNQIILNDNYLSAQDSLNNNNNTPEVIARLAATRIVGILPVGIIKTSEVISTASAHFNSNPILNGNDNGVLSSNPASLSSTTAAQSPQQQIKKELQTVEQIKMQSSKSADQLSSATSNSLSLSSNLFTSAKHSVSGMNIPDNLRRLFQ